MKSYEYMKEYECNGVKPDLPDDVKIEFLIKGQSSWFDTIVGELVWANGLRGVDDIEKFRIVDERWKPKTKNDWPQQGDECEYHVTDDEWVRCKVLGRDENALWLKTVSDDRLVTRINYVRPLRTGS